MILTRDKDAHGGALDLPALLLFLLLLSLFWSHVVHSSPISLTEAGRGKKGDIASASFNPDNCAGCCIPVQTAVTLFSNISNWLFELCFLSSYVNRIGIKNLLCSILKVHSAVFWERREKSSLTVFYFLNKLHLFSLQNDLTLTDNRVLDCLNLVYMRRTLPPS